MKNIFLILIFYCCNFASAQQAILGELTFSTAEIGARYGALTREIRCPTCEAQNIADSNAPLAIILKKNIASQLEQGKSDSEIKAYLINRYGEFIIYNPPMEYKTLLLWLGPILLMLLIFSVGIICIKRKKRSGLSRSEMTELNAFLKKYKD